jgi:hypothetical protein
VDDPPTLRHSLTSLPGLVIVMMRSARVLNGTNFRIGTDLVIVVLLYLLIFIETKQRDPPPPPHGSIIWFSPAHAHPHSLHAPLYTFVFSHLFPRSFHIAAALAPFFLPSFLPSFLSSFLPSTPSPILLCDASFVLRCVHFLLPQIISWLPRRVRARGICLSLSFEFPSSY